jgi:transcriptional regulator with XRE-family HTH domain
MPIGMQRRVHPSRLLKSWRKDKGISQEALAERLGVLQSTVSRLENRNDPREVGLKLALDIERVTQIPARVWLMKGKRRAA